MWKLVALVSLVACSKTATEPAPLGVTSGTASGATATTTDAASTTSTAGSGSTGSSAVVDAGVANPVAAPKRSVVMVAPSGGEICALLSDDKLRCWGGDKATPVEATPLPGMVQLVGKLAIDKSGVVWERRSDGVWEQTKLVGVKQIAENPRFDLRYLVMADGTVKAHGQRKWVEDATKSDNWQTVEAPVAGLTNIVEAVGGVWQVATSPWKVYGCARDTAGAVHCWGQDRIPERIEGLVAEELVLGAPDAVCAREKSGDVSCWWRWSKGSKPKRVAAPLAGAKRIFGDTGGIAILDSAGQICGIYADGALKCAELGAELFKDPTIGAAKPIAVPPAKSVAFAAYAGFATLVDGGVMAWGYNNGGQLGDGTLTDRETPARVLYLLDDTLPPVETGFGKEQQATLEMDWSGLPAKCKQPTELAGVPIVASYAVVGTDRLHIHFASYRIDPHLRNEPRGQQKLARIDLYNYGPKLKELPITTGTYKQREYQDSGRLFATAIHERGKRRREFSVAGDQLELTHLDKQWACGTLTLAKVTAPFAARITTK